MLAAAAIVCVLLALAASWRRAARETEARRAIFTDCTAAFDACEVSAAPDGYPRLDGRIGHETFRLSLIPDSLTIKRLPQLWLSIQAPCRNPETRIVLTARPRPDDFFSAAARLPHRIAVPGWLPDDLAIRSDRPSADAWLLLHLAALRELFADPLVKELEVGPRGLRLIYRLAEGERGRHLLLRQSSFVTRLTPDSFLRLRRLLDLFKTRDVAQRAVA